MRDFSWSAAEKKIARAAHEAAYSRECAAIRREVELMLQTAGASDWQIVWRIEEYLRERRREIDQKYDYRYSVLMLLFARLIRETWLSEDELAGLCAEKIVFLRNLLSP